MTGKYTIKELYELHGGDFYSTCPVTKELVFVYRFFNNVFIVENKHGERVMRSGNYGGWSRDKLPSEMTPAERAARQREERNIQNARLTAQLRRETALKNTKLEAKEGKIRVVTKFTVLDGGSDKDETQE